jgi:hypothetical protein
MKLIYAYIKQFRNIINQEIYFSDKYYVKYNPSLLFPEALTIIAKEAPVASDIIHKDSKLSNIHVVVGRTGAGKTNIFQMIGMTEMERTDNEDNRGSYFLLYEDNCFFLIEPFNIKIDEKIQPKHSENHDPAFSRISDSIKEHFRIVNSMQMYSFNINTYGKPMNIKAELESTLGKSDKHTFVFNGYDRSAFSFCPYTDNREDYIHRSNRWQERNVAEFNHTSLNCSCRFLKEYIEEFAPESIKQKAAIVIRCDNWAGKIKQHLNEKLERHDYWKFVNRNREDEETYVLKGVKKKRKPVSVKNQFVHDLWTDYALYLREWISYIMAFTDEIEESDDFLDYYFEKEQEEDGVTCGIDPTTLPDFEKISILKRLTWLSMWIDRRGGEYAKSLLWQIAGDIKDIGNILNKFDDKYFTNTTFTLPIMDMYTEENKTLVEDLFERMENYIPDDTGIFTKELLPYHFTCISSGEFQLAKILGGIEEYCVRLSVGKYGNHPNLIYLLDEPETYMHPELCRRFIKKLDLLLKERASHNDIQVLISTHSPFMLSDILPEQITRLDVDSNGYCIIKNGSEKPYFGANIHTILSDGFFLEYTIGEFARQYLQEKINLLKNFASKHELTTDEQKQLEEIKNIVPVIGDTIIRQSFEMFIQMIGDQHDKNRC